MTEQIELCGKIFEIRATSRRKRIAVGVDSSGTWFIGAPDFYPREKLIKALTENEGMARLIEQVEKRAGAAPGRVPCGEPRDLPFRGETFALRWTEEPGARPFELRGGVFYISGLRRGREAETIEEWYGGQLREMLGELLPVWTKRLCVSPRKITIKSVKTIWGSCSGKGRITFNLRLAALPPELMEYVVVHELVHLKHMNHSEAFWREVGKHLADYQERRIALKKFSAEDNWL